MENEPKPKRTDKIKKKTLGGYYSSIRRWRVNGKSSKELKEIIADMRGAITHQLVRIRKIKYVLEIYKAKDVTQKLLREKAKVAEQQHAKDLLRRKINRREDKIENLDSEVGELELTIKQQEREIAKLNRELGKKDETLGEVRQQKRRGYTKTVKVQLSPVAKRIQKLADKGVDEKTLNNLEYLTRTYKFIKDKGLTFELLTLIIQTELLGDVRSGDMMIKSYKLLNKLTELGYLNSNGNAKGAMKYWYITPTGKQLIKDYKNYLSHGKSLLTT